MTHPLLAELVETLDGGGRSFRVLLIGVGSGRHIPPLLEKNVRLDAIEEDPRRAAAAMRRFGSERRLRTARWPYRQPYPFRAGYAAALATHALLHGEPSEIAAAAAEIRARLLPGGTLFATFGSTSDPRFGAGRRLGPATFAPESGSESGMAHSYFDERGVRALLPGFDARCTEESAAESAGAWAHAADETAALVHWFVRARRLA